MEKCAICLDVANTLITPNVCSCKIYLHRECLDELYKKLNIMCPICRKNNNKMNFDYYFLWFCEFIYLTMTQLLLPIYYDKTRFAVIFFIQTIIYSAYIKLLNYITVNCIIPLTDLILSKSLLQIMTVLLIYDICITMTIVFPTLYTLIFGDEYYYFFPISKLFAMMNVLYCWFFIVRFN